MDIVKTTHCGESSGVVPIHCRACSTLQPHPPYASRFLIGRGGTLTTQRSGDEQGNTATIEIVSRSHGAPQHCISEELHAVPRRGESMTYVPTNEAYDHAA